MCPEQLSISCISIKMEYQSENMFSQEKRLKQLTNISMIIACCNIKINSTIIILQTDTKKIIYQQMKFFSTILTCIREQCKRQVKPLLMKSLSITIRDYVKGYKVYLVTLRLYSSSIVCIAD